MATRTSFNQNTGLVNALTAAVRTADATGSAVDAQGFDEIAHIAHFGVSGDSAALTTAVKIEAVLYHSDSSTQNFTATTDHTGQVSGASDGVFALVDGAADDDQAYKTSYYGTKRFTQVVINYTGTHTTGTPVAVTALKMRPYSAPVA